MVGKLRIKKILEGKNPINLPLDIIEDRIGNNTWSYQGEYNPNKKYSLRDVFKKGEFTYIVLTDNSELSQEDQDWLEKLEMSGVEEKINVIDEQTKKLNQDLHKELELLEKKLESEVEQIEKDIKTIELTPGEKGDSGEKGDKPIAGVDYEIPKDGEDYVLTEEDKEEIASKIKVPIVEKVIEKTEVIKEQPIITNEIKEVAKYEDPLKIANKLNTLEEKVKIKVIEGLKERLKKIEEELKKLKKLIDAQSYHTLGGRGFTHTVVIEEIPAGVINDANTVFTLAHIPVTGTLKVFLGGARQQSGGGDYTLVGSTITFNLAPQTGSILLVDYEY